MWDKIIPIYAGYASVERELASARVAAAWDVVGHPSASLTEMSRRIPLRLIDLQVPALASGLFEKYPFYTPTIIPAGTYNGQTESVPTFQDTALWVAGSGVDVSFVYQALSLVFSEEGLRQLTRTHPALNRLKPETARPGLPLQLHPGAERFWRESHLGIRPDN
jgi:TRAP transporter TAXI family solute receptor